MKIEDAIKTLKELRRETNDPWYEEVYNMAIKALEATPSADRPQGQWIDKGWKGDWQFETDGRGNCWYEYECSECGYIKRGGKSNYCPNCGADMRKREDQ